MHTVLAPLGGSMQGGQMPVHPKFFEIGKPFGQGALDSSFWGASPAPGKDTRPAACIARLRTIIEHEDIDGCEELDALEEHLLTGQDRP